MYRIFFLCFVILWVWGCVEEGEEGTMYYTPLFLDASCSPEEQEWAYEGVDQLNAVFGYERVHIQGVHAPTSDPSHDGISMLYCDDRVLPYRLGQVEGGDITMFSAKFDGRYPWLSTFLHELGHFVGVHEHLDDPHAVMYPYQTSTPVLEYTEADIQALLHTDI